jgi:septal ring factor EnvC (AmiA/AmiB activator)
MKALKDRKKVSGPKELSSLEKREIYLKDQRKAEIQEYMRLSGLVDELKYSFTRKYLAMLRLGKDDDARVYLLQYTHALEELVKFLNAVDHPNIHAIRSSQSELDSLRAMIRETQDKIEELTKIKNDKIKKDIDDTGASPYGAELVEFAQLRSRFSQ